MLEWQVFVIKHEEKELHSHVKLRFQMSSCVLNAHLSVHHTFPAGILFTCYRYLENSLVLCAQNNFGSERMKFRAPNAALPMSQPIARNLMHVRISGCEGCWNQRFSHSKGKGLMKSDGTFEREKRKRKNCKLHKTIFIQSAAPVHGQPLGTQIQTPQGETTVLIFVYKWSVVLGIFNDSVSAWELI